MNKSAGPCTILLPYDYSQVHGISMVLLSILMLSKTVLHTLNALLKPQILCIADSTAVTESQPLPMLLTCKGHSLAMFTTTKTWPLYFANGTSLLYCNAVSFIDASWIESGTGPS